MRITSTSRIYFVDHNTKTTSWEDPRVPSALGADVPQYTRDFRRKLIYFRSQPPMQSQRGNCILKVRRSHIFEASYDQIMSHSPNDLKRRFMIQFDGEEGLDYGGVSRFVDTTESDANAYFVKLLENTSSYSHMRSPTPSTACLNILLRTTTPFKLILHRV